MEKSNIYSDREGMIASGFLIIYLLFSYVFVYWTNTISHTTLSRESMVINIVMYVIPCLIVVMMVLMKESTLTSLGMNKKGSQWLFGLFILALVFYDKTIFMKILIVVISEEVIFRGYAADRLRAAYGSFGSIVIAGFVLGALYSLIPIFTCGIGMMEFGLYIGIGIFTQFILQGMFHYFGTIYFSILLHLSVLFIAL